MRPGPTEGTAACANTPTPAACNWLVPLGGDAFCPACRLNRTIPDLSVFENGALWARLEREKRRLVYALLRFGLTTGPRVDENGTAIPGLQFDFLADDPAFHDGGRVLTGHAAGVITINVAEADPVARARMQAAMDEPYRTILGHLRHESGHYFWDRLIAPDGDRLARFRTVFGDERQDYAAALDRHYAAGPPPDWSAWFVSAYAASHPWEDWAESWAHYLNLVDTLETARAFGLSVEPEPEAPAGPPAAPDPAATDAIAAEATIDPYRERDFDRLIARWLPLTVALNSLTRAMGQEDAYPFALTAPAIEKLRFVHDTILG